MTDRMDDNALPDEGITVMVVGHIVIRDVTTGEVLLNRRDKAVVPMQDKGE